MKEGKAAGLVPFDQDEGLPFVVGSGLTVAAIYFSQLRLDTWEIDLIG